MPELAALTAALAPDTVLDGELVVLDADGRVDFEGMRRRGFGQAHPGRLVFVAFDVLALTKLGVTSRVQLAQEAARRP
jgi:ATP-dependent DNA ligase